MRAVFSAALGAALYFVGFGAFSGAPGGACASASPLRVPLFGEDPAAAQALFTEAKKLMAAGKYPDACPKLEESERIAPATGTKFNLSDCYEHVGRTASAWAGFLSVAAAAKNASQPAREKAARDRAKALEAKLSRIAVVVPDASNVAGLEVKRDDELVGSAEWNEALPVDPGQHTVSATAPGKRPWKAIIEVAPAGGSAKVIVPPFDDEPAPPPAPVAAAAPAAALGSGGAPPAPDADSSSGRVTGGWVLVGTGAAALIGGGVFWAMRSSEVSTLTAECHYGPNANGCPSSASGDISSGKTYDVASVALFAVGGAAVLGGGALLLFGGGHAHAAASAQIVPVVGPQGGGIRLTGSF
jgi:hypothetical protein